MKIKLKDVADLVGGALIGDENVLIENIAKIEEAKSGDLTFLYLPAYEKYLESTEASAIIVKPGFSKRRRDISYIEVDNPSTAFLKVVNLYFKPEFPLAGIDASASIDKGAVIGENVAVGKNVVISNGCRIGDNVKIFHNTVLMDEVEVGDNCLFFPNITIREKCRIGNNVIINSGSVIGSDGFGFTPDKNGIFQKIPQIGIVIIEDDVELGSNVSVDRASVGATVIKKGVKIDNLVQIAHNVTVGENTVMSAQSGIAGSVKVGHNCMIGGQAGITGHIEITDRVMIGAQSGISKAITKPGTYFGSPAQEIKNTLKLEAYVRNLPAQAEKIKELEKKVNELNEKLNKLSERGII
ncbi:MAG: UDP-3-O-(3-hydroxymyristoyl)glucosamine N-acyltransferase [Ignavibacteria bacterium]